jgi:hypothetical protein
MHYGGEIRPFIRTIGKIVNSQIGEELMQFCVYEIMGNYPGNCTLMNPAVPVSHMKNYINHNHRHGEVFVQENFYAIVEVIFVTFLFVLSWLILGGTIDRSADEKKFSGDGKYDRSQKVHEMKV